MELFTAKQVSSKVISARIGLHAIFVTFIMSCWPVYYLVYYKKTDFKWAEVYGPLVFFYYAFMAACIYFTVFVILKERPEINKTNRIFIKISGLLLMVPFYICTRYFMELKVADWVLGMTSYSRKTTFAFFFHDNLLNAFYVIFGSLFVKFMDDWYITDRIKSSLEKQNLRLELDFLKSQVNPHFLFNTLNNIQSFIVQDEKMRSIELIGRLSEFMRFALYECNEEYIELSKEVDMLADYVELERVRCDDRVRIDFQTSGNFTGYRIPPLLLMPFVENAFKHGADDQLSDSWISIFIKELDGQLTLWVENNFVEDAPKEERSGGIGLQNVKKRLKHYFPGNQDLQISINQNRYLAELNIRLK